VSKAVTTSERRTVVVTIPMDTRKVGFEAGGGGGSGASYEALALSCGRARSRWCCAVRSHTDVRTWVLGSQRMGRHGTAAFEGSNVPGYPCELLLISC
jgi:hypothetical protein